MDTKRQASIPIRRLPLLSWLIIPIIGIWITASFIMGKANRPPWEIDPEGANYNILADRSTLSSQVKQRPSFNWNGEGLVTFWFDDGFLSQYQVAFSILDDYGFPAALAVTTKAPGLPNYMNWAQIKHLQIEGWEITAHSRTHDCNPDQQSQQYIESEVVGSKQDLEEHGFKTDIFVAPCGEITPQLLDVSKQHYRLLRTSDQGYNDLPIKDPYNIQVQELRADTTEGEVERWVEEAKMQKKWLIIMSHRVNFLEGEYSTSHALFRKVVKVVNDSKLPVVLPSEVLELGNNKNGTNNSK